MINWLTNADPLFKATADIAGHDLAKLCSLADAQVFWSNDGDSPFTAFSKGVELAEKAAGRPILAYRSPKNFCVYFIGTPDEVLARVKSRGAEW
jgi:hypothetical protein